MIKTEDLPASPDQTLVVELDDGVSASVEMLEDGTFYGRTDRFDFVVNTPFEMAAKLNAWGATIIGWENA